MDTLTTNRLRRPAGPAPGLPPEVERALTEVARAVLRLEVPRAALGDGTTVDRAGYWFLVRISESAPVRLSDLAAAVELDLSTASRHVRDLVVSGLVDKVHDPEDGRAWLLSLTGRGVAVLEAVSEARRQVLDDAVAGWSERDRARLAAAVTRLAADLPGRSARGDGAGSGPREGGGR